MRLALTLLAALLAGCPSQPVRWTKGGSDADFARDDAQCDYEAAAATAGYGPGQTPHSTASALGQGFGAGLGRAIEERKLSAMCLRAKGYVPQGEAPAGPVPKSRAELAIAHLDDLRMYVTTVADADRMFGPPTSQSDLGTGTLRQWIIDEGGKGAHIAILFGRTGTAVRLTHQSHFGF